MRFSIHSRARRRAIAIARRRAANGVWSATCAAVIAVSVAIPLDMEIRAVPRTRGQRQKVQGMREGQRIN